jgi:hypothetical protein
MCTLHCCWTVAAECSYAKAKCLTALLVLHHALHHDHANTCATSEGQHVQAAAYLSALTLSMLHGCVCCNCNATHYHPPQRAPSTSTRARSRCRSSAARPTPTTGRPTPPSARACRPPSGKTASGGPFRCGTFQCMPTAYMQLYGSMSVNRGPPGALPCVGGFHKACSACLLRTCCHDALRL